MHLAFVEVSNNCLLRVKNGRGGIRTLGNRKATPVFKTGAFDHSATLPIVSMIVKRLQCFDPKNFVFGPQKLTTTLYFQKRFVS